VIGRHPYLTSPSNLCPRFHASYLTVNKKGTQLHYSNNWTSHTTSVSYGSSQLIDDGRSLALRTEAEVLGPDLPATHNHKEGVTSPMVEGGRQAYAIFFMSMQMLTATSSLFGCWSMIVRCLCRKSARLTLHLTSSISC
jgi:hypothetical protein